MCSLYTLSKMQWFYGNVQFNKVLHGEL